MSSEITLDNESTFRPFPTIENDKIDTEKFLDSASHVVTLVEKFGMVFQPVVSDMCGNIEKITKCYKTDVVKNKTLNDLLLAEKAEKTTEGTLSLLWLTRALHFVELFLEQIMLKGPPTNDSSSIKEELSYAYSLSLKEYHGWPAKTLFSLISRISPSRMQLYQSLGITDMERFPEDIKVYIQGLRANRSAIQSFYSTHQL